MPRHGRSFLAEHEISVGLVTNTIISPRFETAFLPPVSFFSVVDIRFWVVSEKDNKHDGETNGSVFIN